MMLHRVLTCAPEQPDRTFLLLTQGELQHEALRLLEVDGPALAVR